MSKYTELNNHNNWRQGCFIDGPEHKHMSSEWKNECQWAESLMVRPHLTGNPICRASSPEDAEWIASRLNRAAELEKLLLFGATARTKKEKGNNDE